MNLETAERFMRLAIECAYEGQVAGDYCLGAVVVREQQILGQAHTRLKSGFDPTAHAEMLAIRAACNAIQSLSLQGCWLVTTLEPCPMCTSAAIWAKMDGVVFGASLEDALERGSEVRDGVRFAWRQIPIKASAIARFGTPSLSVVEDVLRKECLELLPAL